MAKKNQKEGPTLSAKERRVKGVHSDISHLKLKGKEFKAVIGDSVLRADLIRTLEGASHVELDLHDPNNTVLQAAELEERIDVELDDLWFRLAAVSKIGRTITLAFEDREVAYMRTYDTPRKAYRDQVTRAQFVLSMIREVKEEDIPVFIPELFDEQPIMTADALKQHDKERQDKKGKGLNTNKKDKGKGKGGKK